MPDSAPRCHARVAASMRSMPDSMTPWIHNTARRLLCTTKIAASTASTASAENVSVWVKAAA